MISAGIFITQVPALPPLPLKRLYEEGENGFYAEILKKGSKRKFLKMPLWGQLAAL